MTDSILSRLVKGVGVSSKMSNVISITTECLDLYSIAFCHNRIQLLRSVTLKNVSDFNLKNLELEITSSPKFFSDHLQSPGHQ